MHLTFVQYAYSPSPKLLCKVNISASKLNLSLFFHSQIYLKLKVFLMLYQRELTLFNQKWIIILTNISIDNQ